LARSAFRHRQRWSRAPAAAPCGHGPGNCQDRGEHVGGDRNQGDLPAIKVICQPGMPATTAVWTWTGAGRRARVLHGERGRGAEHQGVNYRGDCSTGNSMPKPNVVKG
jgi:hypothetical protein